MPSFNLIVETPISHSIRAKQLEGIFEMPPQDKLRHEWTVKIPWEEKNWNVGLIVGPSGSGKTLIGRRLFGEQFSPSMDFSSASVIDDFDPDLPISEIASACQAVGFNTIPSWLKPYAVLSNGEKFRVELARRLIRKDEFIVIDEFSSVVDRQVGKICANAVQKYVRKQNKKFVAVTCHYDVIEWLQPDWIFDTQSYQFQWRDLQRRPKIDCTVSPVPHSAWAIFAPFHYMSQDLHPAARCFGLFLGDQIVSFIGIIHRPISAKGLHQPIYAVSRSVTLPDYQGLGLHFALQDRVAALYKAQGKRLRGYPAHPSLIRSLDRSPNYKLIKAPGMSGSNPDRGNAGKMGGRPCAVFEYVGPAADPDEARRIFNFWEDKRGKSQASREPARV
jgi:hypothetical protein